ncbi:MAG: V-type ATP synthase subunit A, partial [Chloroflexi bacterium]|nr:V-type ATP synthase subunit A [Chloroflexota bacterium]
VIGIRQGVATVQVYEDTTGIRPGDAVYGTGAPLSVELGPGLVGRIYDGIQRPLVSLADRSGDFIQRGVSAPPLDREVTWEWQPVARTGATVQPGDVLGVLPETPLVEHRVMAPPDVTGEVTWLAPAGQYTVDEPVARVSTRRGERTLTMMRRWAVRTRRPVRERLQPSEPLVTGQRVIDTLFPLAKGGTAALPGGFGAGKTVLQHALAKFSDADLIVYVGCGERGNEITDVLTQFPRLIDPRTGHSLMERTLLIANTSNMPVAAREASIYTGITLAEYYRDMGYHVALMADSTSRWAEALREVSGRLEEMPAEEGFPAYLPSRLASFYERAGLVTTLGGQQGSVSIVGAVSPPGGDFSEPVTQHTRRFIRTFWALDKSLAAARHFPAINWLESYSGYVESVTPWWSEHVTEEWPELRQRVMGILQQESQLQEIVRLVGPDTLPDDQRFLLFVARMIHEAFLQQNALDPIDASTSPGKQVAILRVILHGFERGNEIIGLGAPSYRLQDEVAIWPSIVRAKASVPNDDLAAFERLRQEMDAQMDAVRKDYVDESQG